MKKLFTIFFTVLLLALTACKQDELPELPEKDPVEDTEGTEGTESPEESEDPVGPEGPEGPEDPEEPESPEEPDEPDEPEVPEEPEIPQEPEVPEDPDSISILAIGNSFSVDAMQYLWQILNEVGYKEIVLGNLYIGSCSLETHAWNFKNNSASYTYYTNDSGTWKTTESFAPLGALQERDWDYITMQQSSGKSGQAYTYAPYLDELISVVRTYCPDSELAWHMTWAYQADASHPDFVNYGRDQMTMYDAILSAVKTAVLPNDEILKVIPNGTAIQNVRTSFIGDNVTRDGYHLSYDKGRYLAGLTYAKSLTGCDVYNIAYSPEAYTCSDKVKAAIKEAVDNACTYPLTVTTSTYVPSDDVIDYSKASLTEIISWEGYDPDNYVQLDMQMRKFAYYNSTDAQYGSAMINQDNADKANLVQFVATPMFGRNDLPDGTLIVQRSGQQYRPEGWTSLDAVNSSSQRPANQTGNLIQVNAQWWGNWNYRAFNLSKTGTPVLTDKTAQEVIDGFGIFVPKGKNIVFVEGVTATSGWYDVNKMGDGTLNGDINMCWAAASANMIQWWQDRYVAAGNTLPASAVTGPGTEFVASAGRKYELALMDMYHSQWNNDKGCHTTESIPWYFEGVNYGQTATAGSQAYPLTDGGYWKDVWSSIFPHLYHGYCYMFGWYTDLYTAEYTAYEHWGEGTSLTGIQRHKRFSELVVQFVDRGITSMTVTLNKNGGLNHATTVWGYEIDNATGLLTRLWITDSDDLVNEPKQQLLNEYAVSYNAGDSFITLSSDSVRYGKCYVISLNPFSGYGSAF